MNSWSYQASNSLDFCLISREFDLYSSSIWLLKPPYQARISHGLYQVILRLRPALDNCVFKNPWIGLPNARPPWKQNGNLKQAFGGLLWPLYGPNGSFEGLVRTFTCPFKGLQNDFKGPSRRLSQPLERTFTKIQEPFESLLKAFPRPLNQLAK